jgi:hypothetical protein
MSIATDRFFYGAAAWEVQDHFGAVFVTPGPHPHARQYGLTDGGTAVVLYKYRSDRRSPWQFTVSPNEAAALRDHGGHAYCALVCHDDGVCCLSYEELRFLVGSDDIANAAVTVSRPPRGSYRIVGPGGRTLPYRIPQNAWPMKIGEHAVRAAG